jgi:hypothetical protein
MELLSKKLTPRAVGPPLQCSLVFRTVRCCSRSVGEHSSRGGVLRKARDVKGAPTPFLLLLVTLLPGSKFAKT